MKLSLKGLAIAGLVFGLVCNRFACRSGEK
jgi:hypothetical protein